MCMDLKNFRQDYRVKILHRRDLDLSPFKQFETWFKEALDADVVEPNGMALATATCDGIPSCRTVLLKTFDRDGFCFYTSYESRKAAELKSNPHAALVFWWRELERQVIIEGSVVKTSRQNSKQYFHSRPLQSQISAFISHQDAVVESRDEIENAYREAEKKFLGKKVPLPSHWGGFRLIPRRFEFWQGGKNRLHDRFEYVLEAKAWVIRRLSP